MSTSSTGASRTSTSSSSSDGGSGQVGAKAAAGVLWVLVSGGLLYGVVQTVAKASQLFGG